MHRKLTLKQNQNILGVGPGIAILEGPQVILNVQPGLRTTLCILLFIVLIILFLKNCLNYCSQINTVVLVARSYPTLCDPMNCSPPGSYIHGILQARILGWVPISSSRGPSAATGRFFTTEPPEKPIHTVFLIQPEQNHRHLHFSLKEENCLSCSSKPHSGLLKHYYA